MTNPSDPRGQRPDSPDSPTEKFGEPGESGQARATEYSEGYGAGGEPADPNQYFEQSAGPNATRQLPPYQSQWGVYDTPGVYETRPYDTQWVSPTESARMLGGPAGPMPPGAAGPTMYGPPTEFGPPGGPPRRNRVATWIALSLGIFAVVVLAAAALGFYLAGRDTSTSAASAESSEAVPTSAPPPAQFPVFPQSPGGGGNPGLPQLPGGDNLGATMGTISANDGSTLTIDSLSGATVTVHTDTKTQVISLGSGTLADLHPGDMVVVQGDKSPDGSILAKIIIGTSVPPQVTPAPTPTR